MSGCADRSVVDEKVDRAQLALDPVHPSAHRSLVDDVNSQAQSAFRLVATVGQAPREARHHPTV